MAKIHNGIVAAELHEPKLINSSTVADIGKVLTNNPLVDGVSALRFLEHVNLSERQMIYQVDHVTGPTVGVIKTVRFVEPVDQLLIYGIVQQTGQVGTGGHEITLIPPGGIAVVGVYTPLVFSGDPAGTRINMFNTYPFPASGKIVLADHGTPRLPAGSIMNIRLYQAATTGVNIVFTILTVGGTD